MKKTILSMTALSFLTVACASHPRDIDAAYVSPGQFQQMECGEIMRDINEIDYRLEDLYRSLKKKRKRDNWQAGVGVLLFWPTLLLLEGGDGPEANEYARLQGEQRALRDLYYEKRCGAFAGKE